MKWCKRRAADPADKVDKGIRDRKAQVERYDSELEESDLKSFIGLFEVSKDKGLVSAFQWPLQSL